jgi:hypothetical protein
MEDVSMGPAFFGSFVGMFSGLKDDNETHIEPMEFKARLTSVMNTFAMRYGYSGDYNLTLVDSDAPTVITSINVSMASTLEGDIVTYNDTDIVPERFDVIIPKVKTGNILSDLNAPIVTCIAIRTALIDGYIPDNV